MQLLLLIVMAAVEPGAQPGRDTGFVPPIANPDEDKPEAYRPPKKDEAPETFVRPGQSGSGDALKSGQATWFEAGVAWLKRKDPFAALTAFEEALRENPSDLGAKAGKAEALYRTALYYQRHFRAEEARAAYQRALDTDPTLQADEDFAWHYELLHGKKPEEAKNVYDPRPPFMTRPWIGPHARVGPVALGGFGLSVAPLTFMRVDVSADAVFASGAVQLAFYVPGWRFSPYAALGGRLAFANPPFGTGEYRQGFELWQVSCGTLGIGAMFSHPVGFYASLGATFLLIGGQRVGTVNQNPPSFDSPPNVFYPFPLPELQLGWLFGG